MAEYKILPNSLEAEQALLGCVLLDNEAQLEIFGKLKDEDFYAESHKKIYKSMLDIYAKSIPVDFVTLTNQLEIEKKLEEIGGIDYITYLTNIVPSAANFKHYMDIVKNNSIRRHLIFEAQNIISKSFESEDGGQAMSFAEKQIFDLSQKDISSELELVGRPGGTLTNVLRQISELAENKGKMRGLPTGYKDFDAITAGLQKGALILLAARPGVGKTSFAMNMAINSAVNEGKKIAIFSLEMSREELMQRALASLAKVNLGHVLRGTMDSEEWKRIWTAEKKLAQSSVYVDDSSMITPFEIISKCRKLKMTEGLDLIVVDYLQLMTMGKSNRESRTQEVSDLTRTLKIAAKELNVPIVVLSQLSRAVETREDHRPVLSDLRESGSIEQDADIVLFLYNPEKYNDVKIEDEPGTVYLLISKHRAGSTGEVKLKWVGEYTTFLNHDERIKVEEQGEE
ncbi:MAG: replicative DNA helicase [Clostridia bacterium]|nr:replicative DNA helicase [Clostridia bacterium]